MSRLPISAIEPTFARIGTWWDGLSNRERWMVGGLGLFLAALIVIYGIVKPLQAARADAMQQIRTYETLNARIRAAGTLSATPPPAIQAGATTDILTASAQRFGIDAAVAQTPEGARVEIVQAKYDDILAWIADLATGSSLNLTRLDMKRGAAPGQVSVTAEFAQ
ncbi:type II secretion system protein M [Sphingosinithalassobacter portus]|uniref:type II secretion system protein M n=1 Tax=Stakelama portus TaxID=2676234 RepID=UPI000D6DED2B|nr:type II secretion system protein M [Sphingosinithalassobacter portus]